jgi:hypothetical protein
VLVLQLGQLLQHGLALGQALLERDLADGLPPQLLLQVGHALGLVRPDGPQQLLAVLHDRQGGIDVERVVLIGVGPVVAGRAELADAGPVAVGEAAGERRPPPPVHHLELEVRVRQRHQHVTALAELSGGHEDPVVTGVGGAHPGVDERRQTLGEDLEGDGDLRPVAGSHVPTILPDREAVRPARRRDWSRPLRGLGAATTTGWPTPRTSATDTLPHWDVSAVFLSLESRSWPWPTRVVADLARLVAPYDRHDVAEPRRRAVRTDVARSTKRWPRRTGCSTRCACVGLPLHVHQHGLSNDAAAGLRSCPQAELTDLTRLTSASRAGRPGSGWLSWWPP